MRPQMPCCQPLVWTISAELGRPSEAGLPQLGRPFVVEPQPVSWLELAVGQDVVPSQSLVVAVAVWGQRRLVVEDLAVDDEAKQPVLVLLHLVGRAEDWAHGLAVVSG